MIPKKRELHLQKLLQTLEIELQDMEQLSVALTHPSFMLECDADNMANNQRLEFLGDAVVDLVVGQYLYM